MNAQPTPYVDPLASRVFHEIGIRHEVEVAPNEWGGHDYFLHDAPEDAPFVRVSVDDNVVNVYRFTNYLSVVLDGSASFTFIDAKIVAGVVWDLLR